MNVFLANLLIDIDIISLLISIVIMFAISDDHQSWTRSVLLCIFSCPSWNIVYLSYNFQWHSTISTWKYASYLGINNVLVSQYFSTMFYLVSWPCFLTRWWWSIACLVTSDSISVLQYVHVMLKHTLTQVHF